MSYLYILRIEARRSLGLWLFLPMVGLALYSAVRGTYPGLNQAVTLWPDINAGIRNSVVFLGPLAAALAAWVAARDRRGGMEDLLSTTPRPAFARDLAALLGSAVWAALAYATAALILVGLTLAQATWSGPDPLILLIGLTGVGAMAALGYALGHFIPSRFVAPLLAVVVFGALVGLSQGYAAYNYLSPVDFQIISIFRTSPEPQGVPQIVWLPGLGATALAAVGLHRHPTLASKGTLMAAMVLAGMGAGMVLSSDAQRLSARASVSFEPVCSQDATPVCVHPAYKNLLPGVAEVIRRVVAPVEGLPGAPVRAEQRSFMDEVPVVRDNGTLYFELDYLRYNPDHPYDNLAAEMARALAADPEAMRRRITGTDYWSLSPAQTVVRAWLVQQAGIPLLRQTGPNSFAGVAGVNRPEEEEALARFGDLDPKVRRTWLEDNYAALRAGELTLEDLP